MGYTSNARDGDISFGNSKPQGSGTVVPGILSATAIGIKYDSLLMTCMYI